MLSLVLGVRVLQIWTKICFFAIQLPIMSMENEERVQLETLREDIQTVCWMLSRNPLDCFIFFTFPF